MPDPRVSPARLVASYALLLVLTAQVTVGAAVLLFLRIGGVPVPVGLLLVLLIAPACWLAASLVGHRRGAAGPGLVWLVLAVAMMTQRREGDLVVDGSLRGLGFLLLGSVGAAVAAGAWRPRATPVVPVGRDTLRGGVPARRQR